MFHRYLSPAAYADRFGATRAAASQVESWLRSEGFTAVHADAQRTYVRATAAASRIDAAFHVRLRLYKSSATVNAGRDRLRANDRPVSVPSSLAGSILGVTGLDNAAPVLPLDRPGANLAGPAAFARAVPGGNPACSRYYGQHKVTGLPEQLGSTTFPTEACGYSARQLRAAYRANMANTGRGQTIALVEGDLNSGMFLTLKDYAAASAMPAPSPRRYAELPLGRNRCGNPFNVEEPLDVEASYDMAPKAHQPGLVRSVPDISADADLFTGMAVGLLTFHKGQPPTFRETPVGGTSLATPLVAGIVTAAQAGQPSAFGFLDPALYKLAGTNAYFDPLPLTRNSPALYRGMACVAANPCGGKLLGTFDDQHPSNSLYTGQVTLPGYDNMTGVGTPNGPKFIAALRRLEG
jgi:subtilase family serine protease